MRIQVKADASETSKTFTFELSELDITDEQWDSMPPDEQKAIINKELEGFDQPYWVLDSFKKK